MCQLSDLVEKSGPTITVGHKKFDVSNFVAEEGGDLVMAGFKSVRASYSGMLLPKSRVAGRPGAEVWEVFGPSGKTVAKFAVFNAQILALA